MTARFKRDIRVTAGSLTIESRTDVTRPTGAVVSENQPILKMGFDITKGDKKDPNQCRLGIWNLKAENRARLQEKGLELIIEAGYVDDLSQIFKGDIDIVKVGRPSVDWITTLEIGDGSKAMKSKRSNLSFRGGQKPGDMLKALAKDLGLDDGNLKEKVAENGARSVLKQLISGVVMAGQTGDLIDEIAASMGYDFSVQDKATQFLGKGEVLPGPAQPLSESVGLIGSPEVGEEGVVTAVSLLNGRFVPRRKVSLDSVVISGDFYIEKVRHSGDTWGSDWTSNLELKPL